MPPIKLGAKNKTDKKVKKVSRLLPEGRYLAKVEWVERGASQKGKPRLRITYVVTAGEQQGKKIYDDAYLVEGATFRLEELVECVGLMPKEGLEVDFESLGTKGLLDMFVGKEVIIKLKADSYIAQAGPNAGKEIAQRRVQFYESIDDVIKAKMAADRAARFAEQAEEVEEEGEDEGEDGEGAEVEGAEA